MTEFNSTTLPFNRKKKGKRKKKISREITFQQQLKAQIPSTSWTLSELLKCVGDVMHPWLNSGQIILYNVQGTAEK
jgi:hypothetical protein